MIEAALRLREAIWGFPLVILLVGAGLYLTVLLRGLQFRGLLQGLRLAVSDRHSAEADGDVSHFQALMISVAASIGGAHVVGVALALAAGGAGALVWMWVAALFAMVVRYAEALLGVRFRETDERGLKSGGPMYFLENGIRWGRLGRVLGLSFAIMAIIASLGTGNGMQAHAVAAAAGAGGVHPLVVGAITATMAGAAILGGIRSIARVAGILVPLALVTYVGLAAGYLAANASAVEDVMRTILPAALDGRAVGGGVAGYTVSQALRAGLAGGAFGGDAGIGTGAIASAAARTREPVRQALVAMLGPLIVTVLLSTLTGLVLLVGGIGASGPGKAPGLLRVALGAVLPGVAGPFMVSATLVAFAFAALLAWGYYGERCIQYLAGERAVLPFRLFYIGIIPLGSVLPLEALWTLADALRGVMALPTLAGLVLLSGIVVRETKSYLGKDSGAAAQPSNRL